MNIQLRLSCRLLLIPAVLLFAASVLPDRSLAKILDAGAYNETGILLREQGDLDGAIESYRQAIKLRPDFQEAMYNLGVALQAKGDLDGPHFFQATL